MPNALLVDEPVALYRKLEQRQTERREISHPAKITLVGTTPQILHGMVRNVSEGGTQIRLDQRLPASTLVKIEYEDNLLLGEVIYCQEAPSGWLVGVRIEHGLFALTAIAAVMQKF
jgi:hypothetical protein